MRRESFEAIETVNFSSGNFITHPLNVFVKTMGVINIRLFGGPILTEAELQFTK